jgi:hypothetical protein
MNNNLPSPQSVNLPTPVKREPAYVPQTPPPAYAPMPPTPPPEPVEVNIDNLSTDAKYSFKYRCDNYEGTFSRKSERQEYPQYLFRNVKNITTGSKSQNTNFAVKPYPTNFIHIPDMIEGGKSRKAKSRRNSRKSSKRNNRKRGTRKH